VFVLFVCYEVGLVEYFEVVVDGWLVFVDGCDEVVCVYCFFFGGGE